MQREPGSVETLSMTFQFFYYIAVIYTISARMLFCKTKLNLHIFSCTISLQLYIYVDGTKVNKKTYPPDVLMKLNQVLLAP
jgi:hypothetical protein